MTHGDLGLRRRSRSAWIGLLVAVLALFAVLGGSAVWRLLDESFGTPAPVTEAEARAYLARAVEFGLARDFDALCNLNGSPGNCETNLDAPFGYGVTVRKAVPSVGPSSVDAGYVPKSDDVDTPGWVLTVRGRDGHGCPYQTEVMVFRDHQDHLKAINIVWWTGARIVLDDTGHEVADPVTEGAPKPCPR